MKTISGVFSAFILAAAALANPPVAEKKPVTIEYHGTKVTEDYQWLENWDDPAVKAWSEGQNAHARGVLDGLPNVGTIRARLTDLLSGSSVGFDHLQIRSGLIFALKHEPSKQQPMLVTMTSIDAPESARVLVDPNTIDVQGLTTIDWYVASPDGKLVAVSMSEGGSESGTVHVFNAADGSRTGDVIPRAQGGTAGGSLAWDADSRGFYYTRYPRKGERPEADLDFFVHVHHHTLGQPEGQDPYEIGKDFPKIAEIILELSANGRYVLASVQNGDGGIFMHWLKDRSAATGNWSQLTAWDDKVVQMTFGEEGSLLAVSRKRSPRGEVVTREIGKGEWRVLIPAHEKNSIETDFFDGKGIGLVGGNIWVQYQAGGPSELMVYGLDGQPRSAAILPPVSSVSEIVDAGGSVLVQAETYLTPSAWWRFPVSGGAGTATKLVQTSPAKLDDCKVTRAFATSKDGTKVPLSIIHRKDARLDGTNPTIIWGYGGYGVNETPRFSPRRAYWLEQGGVFVMTNIRGGGEYGEEWHLNGNLLKKQNVFDDFAAACRFVVEKKISTPDKLAIMGGSNGGLLMGATFTQNPGLCKACVSSVGIYDMLRVELSANGAFNITEFGTVKDKDQFAALYAYSPLHHVKDGVKYPNVLFMTGANDPRVDPMQSRKMTARLQAASPGSTTLLRTSANSGHGVGSSLGQRIEEYTDVFAFLCSELGVSPK